MKSAEMTRIILLIKCYSYQKHKNNKINDKVKGNSRSNFRFYTDQDHL